MHILYLAIGLIIASAVLKYFIKRDKGSSKHRKVLKFIFEYVDSARSASIFALIIVTLIIQTFKIPTGSMIPTLNIGNHIMVNKFVYYFTKPKRGDIIVFVYPVNPKKDFIKRLVGFPGETIQIKDGSVFINKKELRAPQAITERYYYNEGMYGEGLIKIPDDAYFVMGDNTKNSKDSRFWGFVPKKNLLGKAFFVYWPLTKMRITR
ncbi:signal peptidase I [bacterium]|nr:signal peptidase I [bacterium]